MCMCAGVWMHTENCSAMSIIIQQVHPPIHTSMASSMRMNSLPDRPISDQSVQISKMLSTQDGGGGGGHGDVKASSGDPTPWELDEEFIQQMPLLRDQLKKEVFEGMVKIPTIDESGTRVLKTYDVQHGMIEWTQHSYKTRKGEEVVQLTPALRICDQVTVPLMYRTPTMKCAFGLRKPDNPDAVGAGLGSVTLGFDGIRVNKELQTFFRFQRMVEISASEAVYSPKNHAFMRPADAKARAAGKKHKLAEDLRKEANFSTNARTESTTTIPTFRTKAFDNKRGRTAFYSKRGTFMEDPANQLQKNSWVQALCVLSALVIHKTKLSAKPDVVQLVVVDPPAGALSGGGGAESEMIRMATDPTMGVFRCESERSQYPQAAEPEPNMINAPTTQGSVLKQDNDEQSQQPQTKRLRMSGSEEEESQSY
jgi:hypothetical protein